MEYGKIKVVAVVLTDNGRSYGMNGRYQILRRQQDLFAAPAGTDGNGLPLLCAGIQVNRIFLFCAKRRTAATNITGQAQYFLQMYELSPLIAGYRRQCLEIELAVPWYAGHKDTRLIAAHDQGLEYHFNRHVNGCSDVHSTEIIKIDRIFFKDVGYAKSIEDPGCIRFDICFLFSHYITMQFHSFPLPRVVFIITQAFQYLNLQTMKEGLIVLKIALAQINIQPGHPDRNTETMLRFIDQARQQAADLIIFPEMAIPGYLLGDTWEQTSFLEDCIDAGKEIIAASQGIIVMFGNIAVDWEKKNNDGRVRKYNAFFTAQDGRLLTPENMPYPFTVKTLMPNYREFDDTRHFFSLQKLARELGKTPTDLISPVRVTQKEKTYTIGCLLCEDGWSDDYELTPIELLTQKAALDLLVNISSSPYTLGKNDKRNRVFSRQAAAVNTPLLYVNNIGLQNNGKTVYTFDGASTVYDRQGRIVLACNTYIEAMPIFSLETLDSLPATAPDQRSEIAHIYRALSYGIRLFLESIHMQRVVIGISGGIDSAVTAALYVRILGPRNVLLVNMPSVFNSATTKGLAQKLANNLGCCYTIFPIQESVELTIHQLENTPILQLADHTETHLQVSSFTAENIQARDRSARVLAGIAAAFNAGFTCNANKAETTVGYSTLYGDQSGFLAALADLWKYQIYDLARYLNTHVYRHEVIPQATIDIVPSAELSSEQNVDEGKGDPIRYPYHDYLFRAFVERWQKAAPQDILEWYAAGTLEKNIGCAAGIVQQYFPTPTAFIADLERWWNLFCGMAVAKRIQAPPILAVSRRAYGFDHREAQNGPYYTRRYRQLKEKLLKKK